MGCRIGMHDRVWVLADGIESTIRKALPGFMLHRVPIYSMYGYGPRVFMEHKQRGRERRKEGQAGSSGGGSDK